MNKTKHKRARKGMTLLMAVALAFGMVPAVPAAALAENRTDEVAPPETLENSGQEQSQASVSLLRSDGITVSCDSFEDAYDEAVNGDTIVIGEGSLTLSKNSSNDGSFVISKQVNIKGSTKGETVLTGAIEFAFGNGNVSVSNLTMKGDGSRVAISFQKSQGANGVVANNATYTVGNVRFKNYPYAVEVGGYARESKLVFASCTFDGIGCAAAIRVDNKNTVEEAGTSIYSGGYAVRAFDGGLSFDRYYYSFEDLVAGKNPAHDAKTSPITFVSAWGTDSANGVNLQNAVNAAEANSTIYITSGSYDVTGVGSESENDGSGHCNLLIGRSNLTLTGDDDAELYAQRASDEDNARATVLFSEGVENVCMRGITIGAMQGYEPEAIAIHGASNATSENKTVTIEGNKIFGYVKIAGFESVDNGSEGMSDLPVVTGNIILGADYEIDGEAHRVAMLFSNNDENNLPDESTIESFAKGNELTSGWSTLSFEAGDGESRTNNIAVLCDPISVEYPDQKTATYASIQDAIDAATDGSTISISPGLYDAGRIDVTKDIDIVGSDDFPSLTIVNGYFVYSVEGCEQGGSLNIGNLSIVSSEEANDSSDERKGIIWSMKKDVENTGFIDGYKLNVSNVSFSGFDKAITVDTQAKNCELSIDGCSFIGRYGNGDSYAVQLKVSQGNRLVSWDDAFLIADTKAVYEFGEPEGARSFPTFEDYDNFYNPPVIPPSGGGSADKDETVTENPDGSTTTTVTEEKENSDGSTVTTVTETTEGREDGSVTEKVTETTVFEDGTKTEKVTETSTLKDGTSATTVAVDGELASVEATVTEAAVESAAGKAVELPMAPIAAASSDEAVEVKVQAPAGAKVAVPVAKAEGADSVAPGAVLVLVDAEGNETVLPKTANTGEALSAEIPGDCALKVVDASASFPDVASDDWHAEQGVVDFMSARGIMTGVEVAPGSFEFQGDAPTNRGMFVTMLNRLEMEAKASSGEGFADVDPGSWYAGSSAWAVEAGIATGYENADGSVAFDGDGNVTREQMATFLFRYAQWLGLDTSARAEGEIEGVSDFAKEAVSWAVAEGLIKGDDTTGAIRPGDGATRAEAAAVVMRMVDLMA